MLDGRGANVVRTVLLESELLYMCMWERLSLIPYKYIQKTLPCPFICTGKKAYNCFLLLKFCYILNYGKEIACLKALMARSNLLLWWMKRAGHAVSWG